MASMTPRLKYFFKTILQILLGIKMPNETALFQQNALIGQA